MLYSILNAILQRTAIERGSLLLLQTFCFLLCMSYILIFSPTIRASLINTLIYVCSTFQKPTLPQQE